MPTRRWGWGVNSKMDLQLNKPLVRTRIRFKQLRTRTRVGSCETYNCIKDKEVVVNGWSTISFSRSTVINGVRRKYSVCCSKCVVSLSIEYPVFVSGNTNWEHPVRKLGRWRLCLSPTSVLSLKATVCDIKGRNLRRNKN